MMVICTMIRMLLGICDRITEIAMLEKAVTKDTATTITMESCRLVVPASAEQRPRICRAIGLLLKIGSSRTFFALTSDIVGLPGTNLFEILLESLLAKPEMEQIGDTTARQGCTRQRINAIHRVLAI